MLRFSLSVAIRQLAGIALGVVLVRNALQGEVRSEPSWWAGFTIAVMLLAPEIVEPLTKAWKTWRGTDGP